MLLINLCWQSAARRKEKKLQSPLTNDKVEQYESDFVAVCRF